MPWIAGRVTLIRGAVNTSRLPTTNLGEAFHVRARSRLLQKKIPGGKPVNTRVEILFYRFDAALRKPGTTRGGCVQVRARDVDHRVYCRRVFGTEGNLT